MTAATSPVLERRGGGPEPPGEEPGGGDEPEAPWWHSRWRLAVLGLALVFLGGAAAAAYLSRSDAPGAASVDVGFLQDMRVHHGQAVALALAAVDRARDTHDPAVRRLAAQVLLDQQAEVGVMGAWLAGWGQPLESERPAMAWMGMGGHGMPGLVTDADLAQLSGATGRDADVFFLQLLRAHHEGGIHMARYAAAHAQTARVRSLAAGFVHAQDDELRQIATLLTRLGGT
jgi:uncharacterized protein (DUF305 family)